MFNIDPNEDGKTHINIYSKGKTPLGRFLTNFAKHEIVLPEGTFQSLEGYWYYLTTKEKPSELFDLSGFEAKNLGMMLTQVKVPQEEFQAKIKKAMDLKIKSSPYWLEEFTKSELPFVHYYVFKGVVKDVTDQYRWIMNHWEARRSLLKERQKRNANQS